jgi:hypothetical protein
VNTFGPVPKFSDNRGTGVVISVAVEFGYLDQTYQHTLTSTLPVT